MVNVNMCIAATRANRKNEQGSPKPSDFCSVVTYKFQQEARSGKD